MLEKIQKFITFRHTITHISPLNAIFNELEMSSGKDPIHSNKTLSDEAIAVFDLFVDKLHQATLAIDA